MQKIPRLLCAIGSALTMASLQIIADTVELVEGLISTELDTVIISYSTEKMETLKPVWQAIQVLSRNEFTRLTVLFPGKCLPSNADLVAHNLKSGMVKKDQLQHICYFLLYERQ